MGIISAKHHDAFFSYASADNDASDQFVDRFRERLEKKFSAIYSAKVDTLSDVNADIFIDHHDLPANGDLTTEIGKAIENSKFLFIFIGAKYPTSKWCSRELEWFRNSFGAKREKALEHTFVIVLDGKAESAKWGEFLDKPERPKYHKFFDDNGSRLSRYLELEAQPGKAIDNPRFDNKLDQIVQTIVERPIALRHKEAPPPLVDKTKNLVGVVTSDLEAARDRLVEQLQQAGHMVDVMTYFDIAGPSGLMKEKLAQSSLLIQPYSYAPVWCSFVPGGHLSIPQS
ncbi:MAG: toll/interleukin-1 receptor domain-containing protein [Methylococcales bacterium]